MDNLAQRVNSTTFQTAYGPKVQPTIACPDDSLTQQQFKEECDINNIMARFQQTGLLEFVNQNAPQYGDVTAVDFTTAQQTLAAARSMFEAMPSNLRERFNNDPATFLDFVHNPANRDEARDLGLLAEVEATLPAESASHAVKASESVLEASPSDDKSGGKGPKGPK